MPQTKSAAKALRQSHKHHERNLALKKKIKDLRKKLEKLTTGGKPDTMKQLLVGLQKGVDKASKRGGFLHRNTAARLKSRFSKKLRSLHAKK